MNRKIVLNLLLTLLTTASIGCGQKGALYLPQDKTTAATDNPVDATTNSVSNTKKHEEK